MGVFGSLYETLFIFDMQGQLLSQQSLDVDQKQVNISATALKKGINMIVLKRMDGSLYVDRIIKQ